MKTIRQRARRFAIQLGTAAGLAAAAPAWAASLATTGPAQPLPLPVELGAVIVTVPQSEVLTPGSAALVPLMAADLPSQTPALEADEPHAGGDATRPVDDLAFVAEASESGRQEEKAAQEALPRLKDPDLKKVAEELVQHHGQADARLTKLAESKGWPLPGPQPQAPHAAGSTGADFDERWTDDTISGHERSVALYRAQAEGGEDKDLRKFARDTLPTIEQHLEKLRRLQK
jgi:putative membrane protein